VDRNSAQGAWTIIALEDNPDCALNLRQRHAPFTEWEAIEQAEIHYVAAYIANKLVFVRQEPQQLSRAEEGYSSVLAELPTRRFFISRAKRRLREEARAGLDRVTRARDGDYDKEWLMV